MDTVVGSGATVVFKWLSDTEACDIQTQGLLGLLAAGNMVSGSAEGNWSANTLNSVNCYIYGTYSTQNPVSYLYYLTAARATLLTSADSGATARKTIRMINELQVSAP